MTDYHDVLLELAESEIAQKDAEIARKQAEIEALRNKLRESLPFVTVQSVQRDLEEAIRK